MSQKVKLLLNTKKKKNSDSKSITMNNLSNKKEGPMFLSELVSKDL